MEDALVDELDLSVCVEDPQKLTELLASNF